MTALPLLAGWEQRGPDARYAVAVHRKGMPSDTTRELRWALPVTAACVVVIVLILTAGADLVAAAPLIVVTALNVWSVLGIWRRADTSLRLDPDGVTVANTW